MLTSPVEIILMLSTGLVALVLVLSGGAKVKRTDGILDTMSEFGVPRLLQRRWIAGALPAWEIGLGTALVLVPGIYRTTAAVLALGTFIIFTAFVIRVLRRGDVVDCGCFGGLSADSRITGLTLARNVVLIVASGAIALASPSRGTFVAELFSVELTALLVSALIWTVMASVVLTIALVRLRRSTAQPHDGPANTASAALEGDPIPDAELVSSAGVTVPLHALGHGSPVLLVFLSAECSKCTAVARRLPEWQRQIAPTALHVATSSRPEALRERVPDAAPFAYFGARSANRALAAEGLPAAVLLGGMNHPYVASPVAHREDEIDALVRGIVAAQQTTPRH